MVRDQEASPNLLLLLLLFPIVIVMSYKTTVVSAPGKVLIAGGYLVLDPAYPGLVIATDSRFYTVIQDSVPDSSSSSSIIVESPQFIGAKWHYKVNQKDGSWTIQQTKETYSSPQAGKNPFLSLAILYTIRLISELKGSTHLSSKLAAKSLKVTIVGDNDFYSQRVQSSSQESSKPAPAPTTSYLKSLRPFESQSCSIKEVHKTGLGSSAAMTTSVVGALMLHLEGVSTPTSSSTSSTLSENDLALVHNLAQLAHCAAQGKVGSGFDVSSAIWGSQLFRRFDPEVLKSLLEGGLGVGVEGEERVEPSAPEVELLPFLDPSNPLWHPSPLSSSSKTTPTAVEGLASISSSSSNKDPSSSLKIPRPAPLELPPFIKLVLADVDTGSNTPSLVSKVNQWKKEKPEWCAQLYHILSISNQSLADNLLGLTLASIENPKIYKEVLTEFGKIRSPSWQVRKINDETSDKDEKKRKEIEELLIDLRSSLRSIRAGMRELGQRSKAEIEPDEMGRILKHSIEHSNGIVGGGVPGAGGFDALYLLYLSVNEDGDQESNENRLEVEEIWKDWKELSVGPLLSQAGGSIPSSTSDTSSQAPVDQKVTEQDAKGDQDQTLELENQIKKVMRLNEKRKDSGIKAGLCVEDLENVKGLKDAVERERR